MSSIKHCAMNRPYISLDEVTKNEFSITCIYLAGSIIQDAEKREGFDMNKNNYHLFTDNEKFILELFYILSDIENCLSSIENACIFVKRFYGKSYFEKCKINIIDYSLYHYDVLCYKISTLKDLYFKLVNYLYDLKLKGKSCSWKSIEKKEEEINNPFLFHLLRENYNNLSVIDNRRNKSAHEGKIEHAAFKDISPYVMLTMYSKTMPISDNVIITRGSYLEYKLKSNRKKFLEETEICKYNAFIFTRCILCSLSETFIQKIDNDTKNKYSATLEKIKQETQGNKCSIGKKMEGMF